MSEPISHKLQFVTHAAESADAPRFRIASLGSWIAHQFLGLRNLESWLCIALWINIVGLWVVGAIIPALGVSSRVGTVPFRAVQFLALILAGTWGFALNARNILRPLAILAGCFWAIYSLRVIYDLQLTAWFRGSGAGMSANDILLFYFLLVLPSIICFITWRRLATFASLLWPVLISDVIAIIGCLLYNRDLFRGDSTAYRLAGNEVLNAITFGHMGTICVLLGAFILLRRDKRSSVVRTILSTLIVLLGLGVVLLSASRGPLLDCGILLALLVISHWRNLRKSMIVILILIVLVGVPILFQQIGSLGIDLNRIMGLESFTQSDSTMQREEAINAAMNGFWEHPFTGSGMFESAHHAYPHNTVIESFMATGIFGGTLYTLMLLVAVWKSLKFLFAKTGYSWLSLIFLDLVGSSLVSGQIFADPTLFGMVALMLAADPPSKLLSRTKTEPAKPRPEHLLTGSANNSRQDMDDGTPDRIA